MFKDMVKKAGREDEFHIASAATSYAEVGNGVYPPARRKLAEHGHRLLRAHRAPHDPRRV